MLRIHDDMLHAITTMRPMLSAIERRDSDLARQLRRCAASVVLNIEYEVAGWSRRTSPLGTPPMRALDVLMVAGRARSFVLSRSSIRARSA